MVDRKLAIYGNLRSPLKGVKIYVGIWFLQILMSPSLYFKDQPKKYFFLVKKDPCKGFINPYFLKLQQKNVMAGENCLCYARCNISESLLWQQNSQKDLRNWWIYIPMHCSSHGIAWEWNSHVIVSKFHSYGIIWEWDSHKMSWELNSHKPSVGIVYYL